MQRAEKNEFSEIEVLETPNWLPSFDATANLDAWNDAVAQAGDNAKQRLANAQQGVKAQNQFFALSPKLAKAGKDLYDANDKRLLYQNQELQQELLAKGYSLNVNDLAAYNRNEDNHNKQTGFFDEQAQKLDEAGHSELAREIRQLTGRRGKVFKRMLIMDAAGTYEADFIKGRGDVSIQREGESDLTWDNAETTAEKRMIMSKWREEHGLDISEIGKFSSELLEDIYYSKVRKVDEKILGEGNLVAEKLDELQNIEEATALFQKSGGLNTGLLGKEVYGWIEANKGRYHGIDGASLKAREILLGLVETGKLSVEGFKSIYTWEGIDHRGTNKKEHIGIFKHFNEDNAVLQSKLEAAEIKGLNANEATKSANALRYTQYWENIAKENGRPFTESELRQIQQGWNQLNIGQPLPKGLTYQIYKTLEDRTDDAIVDDIEDKLSRGERLTDEYTYIKGSTELYEKYQKITASELGQGLDPALAKDSKKYVKSLVQDHFEMTQGVMDTDSPEYLIMLNNAQAVYATAYRNAEFHTAKEKDTWARQQVEAEFAKPNQGMLRYKRSVRSDQSYTANKLQALNHITKNGVGSVRQGILPGTEESYKLLEKWAANPTRSIPPLYNVLAQNLNVVKNGKKYTGWHLANEQYIAVTGKELPKPPAIGVYESKSPMVQHNLSRYPSSNSVRRAAIIDKGGNDFNIEGALLPGLQMA